MNDRQLLIVEDNAALSELLRDAMAAFGFNVLVAYNGAEALATVATYDVDAIVADVELPGMSGVEFCRLVRRQEAATGRSVLIWLMTGSHEADIETQAKSAGAHRVVHKPFSLAQLGAELTRATHASAPEPA